MCTSCLHIWDSKAYIILLEALTDLMSDDCARFFLLKVATPEFSQISRLFKVKEKNCPPNCLLTSTTNLWANILVLSILHVSELNFSSMTSDIRRKSLRSIGKLIFYIITAMFFEPFFNI